MPFIQVKKHLLLKKVIYYKKTNVKKNLILSNSKFIVDKKYFIFYNRVT